MAQRLSGKEVAQQLKEKTKALAETLQAEGHPPTLAVIRVGARPDDVYYEGSIIKHCQSTGILCQPTVLPPEVSQEELEATIKRISDDPKVNGIFFFCPLPKNLDETAARALIAVNKDIDSLTLGSAAKVFVDDATGFAPCTPKGVMELLQYYEIPLAGKRVVILGRSLVVGKPLAMLLLKENATVTICHSKTKNLAQVCQEAEILIAAVGRSKMVTADFISPGQIVIDVGINQDPDQPNKICGDVDYQQVEPIVQAITPVPGGIGSVTTAVLCKHTVTAAARQYGLA